MKKMITVIVSALLCFMPTANANVVGKWEMNERHDASILRDSSGNGLRGVIGSHIKPTHRSYHKFTRIGQNEKVPGRVDRVPDHPSMDPGSAHFSVTARVLFNPTLDRNIVQKGQGTADSFKMKAKGIFHRGYVSCLFRGTIGDSYVDSKRRLDNGRWHTIKCVRNANGTTMYVDGIKTDHNDNDPGVIKNDWPLAIGGNTYCWQGEARRCNYWIGKIGFVRIWKG